ncbi:MAG: tripartite tricarboxylate transporter TctB family protein [Spongiibacteraceae bacterium]|nr:tripartite tricarboxylate transporter TctB family protein [Spongiibacteraceae bacterium]
MTIFNNRERLGSLLLLTFSLFYLLYSFDIPTDPTDTTELFSSRSMPMGLAITSIFVCLLQLISSSINKESGVDLLATIRSYDWRSFILLTVCMLIYALSFSFLGFVVGGVLFLLATFWVLGERKLGLAIGVAVGLVITLWAMLTQLFGIYLDAGALVRLLGDIRV